MHFLFTASVYHTNQHFAVKALQDAGHEVSYLALAREQSEVYDALCPTILGEVSRHARDRYASAAAVWLLESDAEAEARRGDSPESDPCIWNSSRLLWLG